MQSRALCELASLMDISETNSAAVSGIAVDSRLLKPSELFFALEGAATDGHAFLEEVSKKKAAAAVVKRDYQGCDFGMLLLRVDNPLASLQLLAENTLKKRSARIFGITGSVGKTTTKEFLTTLLKQKYKVASSPGNSNSQIGLPLAILNHTKGDEDILVLEMGMTHQGQIKTLVDIAPPEVAVITSVALVHACNFESLSGIARAKGEIFSHPLTKIGILHRDIADYEEIEKIGSCKKVSFSTSNPKADYQLHDLKSCLSLLDPDGKKLEMPILQLPGRHNQHNFLAAAVAANYAGLEWVEIAEAMKFLNLHERRLEHIEKDGILFINDSYNAAPISMKAALESMPEPRPGSKRIGVIGEMLELGNLSEKAHQEIADHALNAVDLLICFGKGTEPMHRHWLQRRKPVYWFPERTDKGRQALVRTLKSVMSKGDVVLLKGSRLNQLWKVLDEV